jgi:putative acetyltransferase
MELRQYRPEDVREVLSMIQETIHEVNSSDYDEQQITAWAEGFKDLHKWQKRLTYSETWVAVQGEQMIGIASLREEEVLDLLFVHKNFQHQGVAGNLLRCIEKQAVQVGAVFLKTEASMTAKPFFSARGFEELEEQTKMVRGIPIKNFRMCKKLNK